MRQLGPRICPECNEELSRSDNLLTHRRRVHKLDIEIKPRKKRRFETTLYKVSGYLFAKNSNLFIGNTHDGVQTLVQELLDKYDLYGLLRPKLTDFIDQELSMPVTPPKSNTSRDDGAFLDELINGDELLEKFLQEYTKEDVIQDSIWTYHARTENK